MTYPNQEAVDKLYEQIKDNKDLYIGKINYYKKNIKSDLERYIQNLLEKYEVKIEGFKITEVEVCKDSFKPYNICIQINFESFGSGLTIKADLENMHILYSYGSMGEVSMETTPAIFNRDMLKGLLMLNNLDFLDFLNSIFKTKDTNKYLKNEELLLFIYMKEYMDKN